MISGRHSSDHLPLEILKKSRSLFDRLSTPKGSPISYHELAIRWPEFRRDSNDELPATFLDCLRRVCPANGMLTFERFCAGLRLALAEEREHKYSDHPASVFGRQQILASSPSPNGRSNSDAIRTSIPAPPTPPQRGSDSVEKTKQLLNMYGSSQSMILNGHNVPPPYDHALSRSRMNLDQIIPTIDHQQHRNGKYTALARSTPQLCEKPSSNGFKKNPTHQNGKHHAVLKNHQQSRPCSVQSTDTNGSLEGIKFRDKTTGINGNGNQSRSASQQQPQSVAPDNRRHTMIDGSESSSSQSKHMRVMREEKELLVKAADTTTRLLNWYNERLSSLETREKLIGKSMIPLDFAVHEEKLNYLRAHITEVNRRAVALIESSDKGFPWHMNLELHRNIPQPSDDQLMWLKRQNKLLTNEVAEKSERIGQLESEKARILKQFCASTSLVNGSSSGGTDSGFHSLTNHSPPTPTAAVNGSNGHHHHIRTQYNPVYATPSSTVNNDTRYKSIPPAPPPPQYQRTYAELHQSNKEPINHGILATLM